MAQVFLSQAELPRSPARALLPSLALGLNGLPPTRKNLPSASPGPQSSRVGALKLSANAAFWREETRHPAGSRLEHHNLRRRTECTEFVDCNHLVKACQPTSNVIRRFTAPAMAKAATATVAATGVAAVATSAEAVPVEYVEFAEELAEEARGIILKYFRQPIPVNAKSDQSPVTMADVEVERAVRSLISRRYPDHAILGEEEGVSSNLTDKSGPVPEYTWVVDPIDGTASFITGKPLFGVLIALLHDGVPVLGLLDQPVLKERWLGVKGKGTTLNGSPVQTRAGRGLGDAYLYTTSPHLFASPEADRAFNAVRKETKRVNYGCDCYAFGLLALGFVDVALEFGVKPWDFMALVPIVEEAGGMMTDWTGEPLSLKNLDPGSWQGNIMASGSKELHEEVLAKLRWI